MEYRQVKQKRYWVVYVKEFKFSRLLLNLKHRNVAFAEDICDNKVIVAIIYYYFVAIIHSQHGQLRDTAQAIRNVEEIVFDDTLVVI